MTQEQQHPITPPPELLGQWCLDGYLGSWRDIATQAAQWGADQQLDTCCKSLDDIPGGWGDSRHLRHVCRPKPPSLKEQAQAELKRLIALIPTEGAIAMAEPIRRALEQLDD